ncbi:MAG: class I SAM-dependent RNA methyltransferase [Treponema sp.]|nr:class I SAM-dependent RNA methyltransferase [Treponema sp.]
MDVHRIVTEKMVFGGDCIAKIDGKTVFVPFTLPGETVDVAITSEFRDYARARIVSVVTPSPDRIQPVCPLYGTCGGCTLQHARSCCQTEIRSSILREAFSRAGIAVPCVSVVGGNAFGYRSRFQLHDGGLMRRESDAVVPVGHCAVAVPEVNEYFAGTPMERRPKGRVHVFGSERLASPCCGAPKVIVAQGDKKNACRQEGQGSRRWKTKKKAASLHGRYTGTVSVPGNHCTVRVGGKDLSFDVQGFFQSNLAVLEKSLPAITGGLSGHHALDMYAGSGTFSAFLADRFDHVTLVEHNRDAVVYAEENLAGTSHESFGVSGDVWTRFHAERCIQEHGPFDAALVDPPRSGMEPSVLRWLCESKIPRINSLSCDCATHARDAAFLVRAGYRLERLYLLDFYPQTCHIESLAMFTSGGLH